MKQSQIIMGMPITIEVTDKNTTDKDLKKVFDYFKYIDEKFSIYKNTSEISKINNGDLKPNQYSQDMKVILKLSEQTKKETNGYFDILNDGKYDPSGIVKGWAIKNAADILIKSGFKNFYIEAGGDIQAMGKNKNSKPWIVGIKNPFNERQIVKVIKLGNGGIATSGTYIRGQHIYNPYHRNEELNDIVSLTVIGPNIYEADRFATAAFAMGKKGIQFIESLKGFEGYMVDKNGIATITSGFKSYVNNR